MIGNDIFTPSETVITPEAMLAHWQGHRRLTRRTIAAFPEKEFTTYSIGGMRPFAVLVYEIMDIASRGIQGIVTGSWPAIADMVHDQVDAAVTKEQVLQQWDAITAEIDRLWPEIPVARFLEKEAAFGLYDDYIINTLLYFIDNEIHHRGQGFVYLRSLGIEPPAFYDRG